MLFCQVMELNDDGLGFAPRTAGHREWLATDVPSDIPLVTMGLDGVSISKTTD
jgi:hypothetical protein